MKFRKNNFVLCCIVLFVSFFTYSGYYAGLGIILEVFGNNASRLYSIPIRLIYCIFCFLMLMYTLSIYLKKEIKFKKSIVFLFFAVLFFIFYLLLEYLVNINKNITQNKSYEYTFYLIAYALFPFLFYSILNYKRYEKIIIYSNLVSGLFLGIISVILYRNVLGSSIGRISALKYEGINNFISPLALSYAASLTITLSIFYWLNSKPNNNEKLFLVFAIGVSIFVFLLGASRGSILTIFSCFLIYFITFNIKKLLVGFSSFILFILLAYYSAIYLGSSIFDRFLNMEEAYSNNDSSVTGRLDIWNEAIFLIKSSPIVGGNFEANNVYPHNIFLEAFMSTGFIGFILFVFITLYGFYLSIDIYLNRKIYLPFVFFTHGIIMGLFSGSLYTSILFFVGLGLVISVYNRHDNRNFPVKSLI